jgi:hypothetical protein
MLALLATLKPFLEKVLFDWRPSTLGKQPNI